MPRLTQKLPKYRKHAASGNTVVTLSGVDHYLGRYGSKASRVLYDRLLAGGRAFAATEASSITIVELSARYWRFAKSYYRKNGKCAGVAPAIKATLRYIKEWYGREPAVEFGQCGSRRCARRWSPTVTAVVTSTTMSIASGGCSSGPPVKS